MFAQFAMLKILCLLSEQTDFIFPFALAVRKTAFRKGILQMNLKDYEDLYGSRRVHIRLSTLMFIKDLMAQKRFDEALDLVETACAADERRKLREAREEIWRRLQIARDSGDFEEEKQYRLLLEQVEQVKKEFRV